MNTRFTAVFCGMIIVLLGFQVPGVTPTQAGAIASGDHEGTSGVSTGQLIPDLKLNFIALRTVPGLAGGLVEKGETALSQYPSWTAQTGLGGEEFGYAVSGTGDVNGDGFADVVVGAPLYSDAVYKEGAVLVYAGNYRGLEADPVWVKGSGMKGSRFGSSLSPAGDVNRDGFADLLVGAYRYNDTAPEEGAAFLFLGSPQGLGSEPAWQVAGGQANAHLGYAVASGGDVNGDGYSDVLVGARFYSNSYPNEGAIFMYLGGPAGIAVSPDWTAYGEQASAGFGTVVGFAGDVNGDGCDDVFVTAPMYDHPQDEEGAVFLFLGSPEGLGLEPVWVAEGNQLDAWFGVAAAGVGDVNGDGYADLLVGAQDYSIYDGDDGAVFLFLGGDPVTGLSVYSAWRADSGQTNSGYGEMVSGAGDVNDDGYADVIVGASRYKDDQPEEGMVELYLGSSLGLLLSPDWVAYGDKADAWFGASGANAGDVDGDGDDDVVLGAPVYRANDLIVGKAFLYLGQSAGEAFHFELFLPLVQGRSG